MAKAKLKCQTCANQVNGEHCTMQKTMHHKSMVYKKCEGYKKYIPKPKPVEKPRTEKPTNYEELGTFGRFLKRGGHYSFPEDKFIGVNDGNQ